MNKSNTSRGLLVALAIAAALALSSKISGLAGFIVGAAALVAVSAVLTPRGAAVFANNFGILNNTTIFHDAFAELWKQLLPITRLCLSVHSEVDIGDGKSVLVRNAKPGDTVTIKNWKQAFTVYNVGANGYNSPTDITPTDKQVTLPNTAKAVSAALTPAEYRVISSGVTGGADYDAFRKKILNGMLHAMGTAIVTDFLALFTKANYPTETIIAAGAMSRSTEIQMEKAFFDRQVALDEPQAILNSTAFAEWVDSHTAIQTNTGDNVQKRIFMGSRQSQTTPFMFDRTAVALPTQSARGIAMQRTAVLHRPRRAMIAHEFAAELVAVLDALAGSEPELATLNRYQAQTKGPRQSPAFIIQADAQRIYRGGRAAILRVTITIESTAGDEKPDPQNHLSRVRLAHRLLIEEKPARLAALAARHKFTVDDWGQVPGGRQSADSDTTGEKLRSVLVLAVAVRRYVAP